MDILDRTLKKLDPEDSAGSFSEIENYLARVMETIDFTLSKQQTELSNVDPDRILRLERSFSSISQDVSSLKRSFSSLSQDVSSLKSSVKSLENRMTAAEAAIQSNTSKIHDHENRIHALENNA